MVTLICMNIIYEYRLHLIINQDILYLCNLLNYNDLIILNDFIYNLYL